MNESMTNHYYILPIYRCYNIQFFSIVTLRKCNLVIYKYLSIVNTYYKTETKFFINID